MGRFAVSRREKVKKLSRGQSTKLMLTLALAHRPELLILDEPTSGLDPIARLDLGPVGGMADSGLGGAATAPKRRSRTPLTANQIAAIQTARKNGESVMSITRRFEVHRGTVWKAREMGQPHALARHRPP